MKATPYRYCALLLLLIAIATGWGCTHMPFRVEWVSEETERRRQERAAAGLDPEPNEPIRLKSANAKRAAWESLHRGLIEAIGDRREGDPVPKSTVEECQLALDTLRELVSADGQEPLDLTADVYTRLLQRKSLAPPRSHVKQLKRLLRDVNHAFDHYPQIEAG